MSGRTRARFSVPVSCLSAVRMWIAVVNAGRILGYASGRAASRMSQWPEISIDGFQIAFDMRFHTSGRTSRANQGVLHAHEVSGRCDVRSSPTVSSSCQPRPLPSSSDVGGCHVRKHGEDEGAVLRRRGDDVVAFGAHSAGQFAASLPRSSLSLFHSCRSRPSHSAERTARHQRTERRA